ncbi:MAG: hypothetical protein ABS35_39825 [Kaistia sp. SCN 65-12]|nr:MAG: hypothetical protein ABS35_39825 [Kaistia sp. SCN 65-12]
MGLAISGMIDPAKVKGFLDFGAIPSGRWDPSLAFVFAAAVMVSMVALRIGHRHRHPIAAPTFANPEAGPIDSQLVIGSLLFGIGWGLSGLCPGPAIANIAFTLPEILIFVAAMAVGWGGVRIVRHAGARSDDQTQARS